MRVLAIGISECVSIGTGFTYHGGEVEDTYLSRFQSLIEFFCHYFLSHFLSHYFGLIFVHIIYGLLYYTNVIFHVEHLVILSGYICTYLVYNLQWISLGSHIYVCSRAYSATHSSLLLLCVIYYFALGG